MDEITILEEEKEKPTPDEKTDPLNRPRLLGVPLNVFWLGMASLLTDISTEMIYPLVPLFLMIVLGAGLTTIGIIEGIAESTASLVNIYSGRLVDKSRRSKMLAVSGYTISTISKPFLALAMAPWHVLVVRFADRFGKGIRVSPRDTLIVASTPKGQMGKTFGLHRTMDTIGAAIGPLLAFWLLPIYHYDFRPVFALSAIAGTLGVLVLLVLVRDRKTTTDTSKPLPRLHLGMFPKEYRTFLLAVTIFALGNSSDAFLIIRAQQIGLTLTLLPIAYFFFNIVHALLSTPAGMVADRIGAKWVLIAGFIMFALVYIGFAVTQSTWAIWLLFAVYGVYYAFTEGIQKSYTACVIPAEMHGTAYGTLNLLTGIVTLPASFIGGLLGQYFGLPAAFLYGAILAGIAFLLMLPLPNGKNTPNEQVKGYICR